MAQLSFELNANMSMPTMTKQIFMLLLGLPSHSIKNSFIKEGHFISLNALPGKMLTYINNIPPTTAVWHELIFERIPMDES